MKKYLVLAVAILMSSTLLLAQSPQGGRGGQRMNPEEQAKRTTERMKEELKLTDDQLTKVDSINLLYAQAQQKLFEAAEGNFDGIREAMQALQGERVKAYEEVLTQDQLAEYKKKEAERQSQRGQRRGEGSRGNRGN